MCPAAALPHSVWPLTLPVVSVSRTVFPRSRLMNLMKFSSASPSRLQNFFLFFVFFGLRSNPGATLWRFSHHWGANMFAPRKSRAAVWQGEMMKFYCVSCSAFFRPVPAAAATPAPWGSGSGVMLLYCLWRLLLFCFFFLRVSDHTHDFTSYSNKWEGLLTQCQVSQTQSQSVCADLIWLCRLRPLTSVSCLGLKVVFRWYCCTTKCPFHPCFATTLVCL